MNVSVGRIVFQATKLLYAALQDWANHLQRRVCMLRVKILNFYIITYDPNTGYFNAAAGLSSSNIDHKKKLVLHRVYIEFLDD